MNKREDLKIPFGAVSITEKSIELINESLRNGRVSSGKLVKEFEEKFARLIGTRESVCVSTGTDADALSLAVLYDFGAKRGDEVILPALSFSATGNAVLQAGFRPVFVDIDRKTLNIDPLNIEPSITKRTRAIMPVHLMGKPAEMDTINDIAKKYKLFVIEDAAEAHGTLYKGKSAGRLGDMGAFSLYVAHMISTIEGGIITTDNEEFADLIRSLRSHGRACMCRSCVLNTDNGECKKRFKENRDIRFIFERIGFSSKMNELEAAVGLGNLDIYDNILAKRRGHLKYLLDNICSISSCLSTIKEESYERIGPHALPVIVAEDAKFSRDKIVRYLENYGIDSRSLFSSMPTQCKGFSFLGYRIGDFPNAEYIGNNGFHIGVHQDLTKKHLDYFLEVMESIFAS